MRESFFIRLGNKSITFFTHVFQLTALLVNAVKSFRHIWFYRRQIVEQMHVFSVKTLPIVSIIAVFIGLGALVLGKYQSIPLIPRELVINAIFKSTILVLGPVILSLVLAGKLGGSLAAEIGSMKISEQIQALQTMSLDPVGFLVMPRIVAGLIMLPVITTFSNFISIFSAFFAGSIMSNWISPAEFASGLQINFYPFEFWLGNLIKPCVYGLIISLVGSYFGMRVSGGARGVGKASTNAVVLSTVLIVICDFYLGQMFLSL